MTSISSGSCGTYAVAVAIAVSIVFCNKSVLNFSCFDISTKKALSFSSYSSMVFFSRIVIEKMRSALLYKMTNEEKHIEEYEEKDKAFLVDISKQEKLSTDLLQKTIETAIATATAYVPQLPLEILVIDSKNV